MVHHLRERVMSFFGYTITGIVFVVVAGLVLGVLAMMIQFGENGGGLMLSSITELTNAFVTFQPVAILIGLIAFFVLGILIWVFGIIGVEIRKRLGAMPTEKISFDKRPALLAFLIAGIITVVIFAGLQAILTGVTQDPDVDLTDIMTLFDAVATGNPLLFIGGIIGLTIIGFLVIKIASIEKKTGDTVLPKGFRVGESD